MNWFTWRARRFGMFIEVVKIIICLCFDDFPKQQDGDQVWNHHQRIRHIGKRPDGDEVGNRPDAAGEDVDQPVARNSFGACQIFEALFSVNIPADNCREAKENDRQRHNVFACRAEY